VEVFSLGVAEMEQSVVHLGIVSQKHVQPQPQQHVELLVPAEQMAYVLQNRPAPPPQINFLRVRPVIMWLPQEIVFVELHFVVEEAREYVIPQKINVIIRVDIATSQTLQWEAALGLVKSAV